MCPWRHRVENRVGGVRTSLIDVASLSSIAAEQPPLFTGGNRARTAPRVGQAKLMAGRFRDLVLHPNQPRSMATEAPDEDDEKEHAFYHHTYPPGYGG